MAAARRPPPVYVLDYYLLVGNSHAGEGGEGWAEPNVLVCNGNLTGKAGEGWAEIEIARREAYGCGDNMRQAANGLSLCVRLGDGATLVTSALGLRVSPDARARFNSELDFDGAIDDGEEVMSAVAHVMMQDQGLLVIVLWLERGLRNLSYYLVYDRSDASLSLVSWAPDRLQVISMFMPVPKRTPAGAYELFLLVCDACDDDCLPPASDTDLPPFLCVFSPATGTKNPTCAWETRRTLKWNLQVSVLERFRTDATFCFQGNGFWADLSQALMYCDLQHTSSSDDGPAVDVCCIELPGECQLDLEEVMDCTMPMKVTRAIACVGDSIWFVCILPASPNAPSCTRHCNHHGDHGDDLVKMWSLKLPGGQWKNEASFAVKELWSFDGFKEEGLPEAKVEYPILMADGSLCLMVTGKFFGYNYSDVSSEDYICTFDVRNKRLLWHGSVHDYIFKETVAIPPDFFLMKHRSHKRKFDK